MLTPFERNLLPSLLERFFTTRALDVVKMQDFVPCQVEDELNKYQATITRIVYDPINVPETNAKYRKAGYIFEDAEMQVIAETADGEILLWGGLNSVFHLGKGQKITNAFDPKHLAFNDIVDL